MTDCQIHNVRFYNLEPKMISCLAYCKQNSKLALTRHNIHFTHVYPYSISSNVYIISKDKMLQ